MDDGIRQVSISASLELNPEQFEALDLKLGGINGAIDKLAENIAEPDTSVASEIASLKEMVGVGFADIRQSLTDLNNTIFDASNNLSNNIGKWLAAIALAAANPADNTAEVQQRIDALTADLKQSSTSVEDAITQDRKEQS